MCGLLHTRQIFFLFTEHSFAFLGKLFCHWNYATSHEDKVDPAKLRKELDLALACMKRGKCRRDVSRQKKHSNVEANHHPPSSLNSTHIVTVWCDRPLCFLSTHDCVTLLFQEHFSLGLLGICFLFHCWPLMIDVSELTWQIFSSLT